MRTRVICTVLVCCFLSSTFAQVPGAPVTRPAASAPNSTAGGETTPQIPQPSGPFGIGRVGFDWTDGSRPDEYHAKRHRELMVYLWYPTAKSAAAKGVYYPGARQLDADAEVHQFMIGDVAAAWAQIVSGQITSHAIENAPIETHQKPFPVVIFSHGLGGTGFEYTILIEDLVSHGYVVASIEHTHAAGAVRFADGRIARIHNDSPPAGLSPAERFEWMGKKLSAGINEGAADVRFVIDRLSQLAEDRQHPELAGALDMTRVAAMGHSAGAEFAARACQQDSRIRACVDLDGGMVPVAALPQFKDDPKMRQQLLFLEAHHPDNQMGGPPDQLANYRKVRQQQLEQLPAGSYAVELRSPGIAHPSFSDVPLLYQGRDGYPEPSAALHNLDLITQFVRAFLDKALLGEKEPLLDGRTSPVPEAVVTAYGH